MRVGKCRGTRYSCPRPGFRPSCPFLTLLTPLMGALGQTLPGPANDQHGHFSQPPAMGILSSGSIDHDFQACTPQAEAHNNRKQMRVAFYSSGIKSLNLYINEAEHLRMTILEATLGIRELSEREPYAEKIGLLRGIPGIGIITAMIIMTELETINRFGNFDKLCSFIGLIPTTHSSGEKENIGEITHRGNSFLRGALVESAWIAASVLTC